MDCNASEPGSRTCCEQPGNPAGESTSSCNPIHFSITEAFVMHGRIQFCLLVRPGKFVSWTPHPPERGAGQAPSAMQGDAGQCGHFLAYGCIFFNFFGFHISLQYPNLCFTTLPRPLPLSASPQPVVTHPNPGTSAIAASQTFPASAPVSAFRIRSNSRTPASPAPFLAHFRLFDHIWSLAHF